VLIEVLSPDKQTKLKCKVDVLKDIFIELM
jgi:hypothetical protein